MGGPPISESPYRLTTSVTMPSPPNLTYRLDIAASSDCVTILSSRARSFEVSVMAPLRRRRIRLSATSALGTDAERICVCAGAPFS